MKFQIFVNFLFGIATNVADHYDTQLFIQRTASYFYRLIVCILVPYGFKFSCGQIVVKFLISARLLEDGVYFDESEKMQRLLEGGTYLRSDVYQNKYGFTQRPVTYVSRAYLRDNKPKSKNPDEKKKSRYKYEQNISYLSHTSKRGP